MSNSIRMGTLLALFALGCVGDGATDKTDATDATDATDSPEMTDTTPTGDSGAGDVDADKDGVLAEDDCDDKDASLGAIALDGDCDGTLTEDDCDDKDAALNELDEDNDTFSTCDGDCDDTVKAVNPDQPEIPGNTVDENCDTEDTADIVLNEMHYDPASGTPKAPGDGGDANFDGVRSPADDEFVELVNNETFPVDVSGFMLFDQENLDDVKTKGPKHTVPAGTVLAPGQALVVFGGGTPGVDSKGATTNDFGGSIVQTATFGDLNLNNGGDVFYLQDASGNDVIIRDIETFPNYTSGADQAYTRSPDLKGKFDLHTSVVKGVLFSPGTRADGTKF